MRNTMLYVSLLAATVLSMGACSPKEYLSVYKSLDGRTELVVSEKYYYMGPANHPSRKRFLEEYGQPFDRVLASGVQCISLGVFKFAKFEQDSASCQNVHIKKTAKGGEGSGEYVGSCFELEGGGCSGRTGTGEPALVYSYKIEGKRGLTEINVAGGQLNKSDSTLILTSGPSIFR